MDAFQGLRMALLRAFCLAGIANVVVIYGLCGWSVDANATTVSVSCPGTVQTTDREFTLTTSIAATCIAFGAGNINGNHDAVNLLGYLTVDKSDNHTKYVGLDGELTITGAGTKTGTFSFTPPTGYHNFVLGLKSGNGQIDPDWVAFLLPSGILSGSWSISKQSLSHVNLYAVKDVAQTPLPGALWLMGTVLAGWCGLGRWRQKGGNRVLPI